MKKAYRLLSLLLILMLLAGCTPGTENTDGTDPAGTGGEPLTGEGYYVIVNPNATIEEKQIAKEILSTLKKKTGNSTWEIADDTEHGIMEIQVGNPDRPAVKAALDRLADDSDFYLGTDGQNTVLAARSTYGIRMAVNEFLSRFAEAGKLPIEGLNYLYSEANPLTDPVSYFNFNEGNGNTAKDSVTGKTATLTGTEWTDGIEGTGVMLPSEYSGKTGLIDFGAGYVKSVLEGTDAATLNLWVMPYQNRSSRLFSFYNDGATLNFYVTFREDGMYFYARAASGEALSKGYYVYRADPAKTLDGKGDAEDNTGIWQMLTFVTDYTTKAITVYVNGEKLEPKEKTAVFFRSPTLKYGTPSRSDVIGQDPDKNDYGFCGIVDEFSLYNCPLEDAEIARLANRRTDTTSPIADQQYLDALAARMKGDAALVADQTVYCSNGELKPLDPKDYAQKAQIKDGKWYVPAGFAADYFKEDVTAKCKADGGTYALADLCAAAGKTATVGASGKIVLISAKATWSPDADARAFTRLEKLLTEFSYALPTSTVEQTRTVVTSAKAPKNCFSPCVAVLDGAIYVTMDDHTRQTLVFRSEDGGKTFKQISYVKPISGATIFEDGGKLYLLGMGTSGNSQICLCASTDKGKTWSALTVLPYETAYEYCGPGTVVKANGRIYKAYEGYKDTSHSKDDRAFVVSAPQGSDLTDPSVWTISSHYSFTTENLKAALNTTQYIDKTYLEEGSVVLKADGSLVNVLRIDAYPIVGHAVTMQLSADGKKLTYSASDPQAIIDLPTGADLFHIKYDAKSGYYISLINIKTTDYRPHQRNVLALAVSKDMKKWTVTENLLVDRSMMNEYMSMEKHGFQYVDFTFDGNDLIFAVREAQGKSENYHDNNYLTFYRLEDFRKRLP